MQAWLAKQRSRSLAARGGMLILVVLVVYLATIPVAAWLAGWLGLLTATVAALLCLFGSGVALVISHLLRAPEMVLYGMLLGMTIRMGLPLGIGLACHLLGGVLADHGLLYYLLIFYPVTLLVETILSLPVAEDDKLSRKVI
jgi:hypothetical protein